MNAKKVLDKPMLQMVYFAMTQSILCYGLTAWGGQFLNKNKLFYRIFLYFTYKLNLINFKQSSYITHQKYNLLSQHSKHYNPIGRYFTKPRLDLLNDISSYIMNCKSPELSYY
ncbi:putative RNA-directed DNA polymerase [Aphis craccivora]|uniref:Putative RNA-directed DNA polymerase n=1 Tax=Aphis craccivora TaxID=307492 RepID=A0A6G0YQC5_APHCR|nr:putative RNA-directed DNA polymerase [Aphis craccivora]